jgi:hypothetical protein
MNPYTDYLSETSNRPRPARNEDAIKHVSDLGRAQGASIRLVWAPEVTRFLWGAVRRVYAFKKERDHVAWRVGPMVEFKGAWIHRPHSVVPRATFTPSHIGAFRLPNGDWAYPQFDYWEVAHPRWLIEEMLDPAIEGPEHEAHRYEYFSDTNEFVDALGPYPSEGKWACIQVIAAHSGVCCNIANDAGRFCYGTGRDFGQVDEDEIMQRVQERNKRARLTDHHGQDFQRAVTAEYRDLMTKIKESERQQRNLYRDIIGEETDTVFKMMAGERQKVAPVERPKAGFKRVRLLNQYGREIVT